MSRDRPFDGLPDSVDDYTGSLPSLGGSVPVSGPRGLLLVVLAGLALAWYARPWFQGLAYGLYTSPALVVVALLTLAVLVLSVARSGGVPGRFTIRAALAVGFVVRRSGAGTRVRPCPPKR